MLTITIITFTWKRESRPCSTRMVSQFFPENPKFFQTDFVPYRDINICKWDTDVDNDCSPERWKAFPLRRVRASGLRIAQITWRQQRGQCIVKVVMNRIVDTYGLSDFFQSNICRSFKAILRWLSWAMSVAITDTCVGIWYFCYAIYVTFSSSGLYCYFCFCVEFNHAQLAVSSQLHLICLLFWPFLRFEVVQELVLFACLSQHKSYRLY